MRALTRKQNDDSQLDLTPMLDVVFILLIFFIVTANFIKEAGIDVNKPEANKSEKKDQESILIAVNNNGEIWMDKRRIDIRQIRNLIEQRRAESPKAGVVIQADQKSTTDKVVAVMDAAKEAGVQVISIATDKK